MEQGIRSLSAVERRLIEEDHARLDRFLRDLRETCSKFASLEECRSCDRGEIASCQGRLISFGHDFLDFVVKHFENEERIMSGISRTHGTNEYFRQHRKEHAKLLREMENLMQELLAMSEQGHTAVAIREFHYRAAESFGKFCTFDDPFMYQPKSGKE